MEKLRVANATTKKVNGPARNVHLEESINSCIKAIVDEIIDIDYLLLTYKRELRRAQHHISGSVVLNFGLIQQIRGRMDMQPYVARMFKVESSWVVRALRYEPGQLHVYRAVGKNGVPLEQDNIVIALLKEIDRLLQMRAKLIALTRPLRQTAGGHLQGSQRQRRKSSEKIDKLSQRIVIDWSIPNSSTDLILKKKAERELRAARKLEKQKPKKAAQ